MEKLLAVWFDDQIQKRMPMNLSIIQTKVLPMLKVLKAHEGEEFTETLNFSHGLFWWLCGKFNPHHQSVNREAANSDIEAVVNLLDQFDKTMEKGRYPEQIFNVD